MYSSTSSRPLLKQSHPYLSTFHSIPCPSPFLGSVEPFIHWHQLPLLLSATSITEFFFFHHITPSYLLLGVDDWSLPEKVCCSFLGLAPGCLSSSGTDCCNKNTQTIYSKQQKFIAPVLDTGEIPDQDARHCGVWWGSLLVCKPLSPYECPQDRVKSLLGLSY